MWEARRCLQEGRVPWPWLRGDDNEDDALPSASVVFVAAVDDPANATAIIAGRGGGVEAGGGDGVGYATLSSLFDDTVRDYHASFATDMPTYYPMGSHAPSTTRITLTLPAPTIASA